MKNKLAGGLLILLISAPFAMSADAQTRQTRQRAFTRGLDLTEYRLDVIKEQLDLTDEQVEQLKQLQEQRRESRKEMNAEQLERREARRAEAIQRRSELADARQADRDALESILTPEQLEKLADSKQLTRVRNRKARVIRQRTVGQRAVGQRTVGQRTVRQVRADRSYGRFAKPNRQARFDATNGSARRSQRANFRNARGERAFAALDLTEDQKTKLSELRDTIKQQGEAWHEANPEASYDATVEFRNSQRSELQAGLKSILTEEQLEELNDRTRRGASRAGPRNLW